MHKQTAKEMNNNNLNLNGNKHMHTHIYIRYPIMHSVFGENLAKDVKVQIVLISSKY